MSTATQFREDCKSTWYSEEDENAERYEDDECEHQEAVAPSQRGHGEVDHCHVPLSHTPTPAHHPHQV